MAGDLSELGVSAPTRPRSALSSTGIDQDLDILPLPAGRVGAKSAKGPSHRDGTVREGEPCQVPWAEQAPSGAMAQGEIRPLMRAGPFHGEDPIAVLHEDEMTARQEDRDDRTAGERLDLADVNPAPLSAAEIGLAHIGPPPGKVVLPGVGFDPCWS